MALELTAVKIAELAFGAMIQTGVGKLTEGAIAKIAPKINQLRQVIWDKLKGRPAAEAALAVVEKNPSSSTLAEIGGYLQEEMAGNVQFAQQLNQLVQEITQEINLSQTQETVNMRQDISDQGKGYQIGKIEGGATFN